MQDIRLAIIDLIGLKFGQKNQGSGKDMIRSEISNFISFRFIFFNIDFGS